MSVYKPKTSPYWLYDFRLSGKRFHGSTKRKSKTEAKAVVAALRSRILAGENDRLEITLDNAAELYFSQKGGNETTMYQLGNLIRLHGANTNLSSIDDRAVASAISRRRGERHRSYKKAAPLVSSTTVNRETELLRAVIKHAARQKYVTAPVDWNSHMLKAAPPRDPILTLEQQDRLIAEAADHIKDPISFTLITGKRLMEVITLDWSQVDLHGRTMVFKVKGGRLHRIPIIPAVLAILIRQGPKESGPVFTYRGKAINSIRTAWKAAKRRAGVELRWHDLRHIAASRMVANGTDISVVKEVLAHTEIKTTMRYVSHQPSQLAAAMESGFSPNSREIPEKLTKGNS